MNSYMQRRSGLGPEQETTQSAQFVDTWRTLSPEDRVRSFKSLPTAEADDFFLDLNAMDEAELIRFMPATERRLWLRLLAPDDAADLIQESLPELRNSLLDLLDESTRSEVRGLLAYKEDVAGGRMSPRFARLRPDFTVDEAIAYLRPQTPHVETIYYAYVTDEDQRLLGVVSFRDLFTADRTKPVSEVMRSRLISVSIGTDQEDVARLFRQHHLLAIPVVDDAEHIRGIITVDDMISVLQDEASEDVQKIGGSEVLDGPYLDISFRQMVRKRAGWLAILFVGEMLTATAMGFFEGEIAKAVVLALFLPLIISSGGNSGSQATTLVIRAMALGEVCLGDWFRVVRREIAAGLVLGCVLSTIGFARIVIWQKISGAYGAHYMLVALTIACSLTGVVTFGTVAGSMLPFILRRCGLDPASASAPFVATLVDVSGLIIYFTIAAAILRGTLL
jgi:magnesium transporter